MRQTLRRSCAACARAKHSCDLRTPKCSRCVRRRVPCEYANQPLTASRSATEPESSVSPSIMSATTSRDSSRDSSRGGTPSEESLNALTTYRFGSLDPFDSYPQTRLPRKQVQRLIHSFLHKIAFQYYPLDLNATSNPFLISWWPLALGDPALFHVSLQTACLDEELLAQKGFQTSEMLMADSVALLRRKVQDPSLAVQDGTMNSVITLAAIEFGKGNLDVSRMHVDGVKRLVSMRGGINAVRQTSPLTARMASWVSMLVMGHPQFETQDDKGYGDGLPPIPEWQGSANQDSELWDELDTLGIDRPVSNVFVRLHGVFKTAARTQLSSTRVHDLTCFVVHRLLLTAPSADDPSTTNHMTECVRFAVILYMFILQGPTYYSHAVIQGTMVARLAHHLELLDWSPRAYGSLDIWIAVVGMAASAHGDQLHSWFAQRAQTVSNFLRLEHSSDVLARMKTILWLALPQSEDIFRPHCDTIFGLANSPMTTDRSVALLAASTATEKVPG